MACYTDSFTSYLFKKQRKNCGSLDVSQPYEHQWWVIGIAFIFGSLDSVIGVAIAYGLDDRWFSVRVPVGSGIFFTSSETVLGPTQLPVQWVKKGKAISVTGRGDAEVCETSRLPHFLDDRLTNGGEVVSLMSRLPFTPQEDPYPMGTGGKVAGGGADHSPPTSVEVKKTLVYTATSPYVFMA
jgi:hypothetical protein